MKGLRVLAIALFAFSAALSALAQVDVARRTTAITYPLDELVNVQFRGTTRFPRMKGAARVRRTSRNGTEIDLEVSKMPRPFELGASYATYVLWAVSPDGQVDNLGEIKRRGFFEFDSKISVTTPLQTFALMITAEPHFLVRRPSQAIMLENLNPVSLSGRVIQTTPAVQYFGNSSDYFRDARAPEIAEIDYAKTPSTILQAKQAVALARYAGADRDAVEELREADALLSNAENAWRAGRDEESVDVVARRAISAAVKAEATAALRKEAREKRNEQTRVDAEIRDAEDKYVQAQNQITELRAELASEIRNRELAERDVLNYTNQVKELREENGKLRDELARVRLDAENTRARLATLEAENQNMRQQADRSTRLAGLSAAEPGLIAGLKRFGTVVRNERGIVLTLPENLWAGIRVNDLSPTAEARITGLSEILANNPDYNVVIESHTDARGTPEELQQLTQSRAQTLADRLGGLGVASARIKAEGLGASSPVAPNTTNANRARNRRIHVILTPSL
jgi:outer membrane protein OmpA-like peptidoglycan-associated protein